ncbi:nucleotidyltransferase family protein, partial [Thermodesulfobacteriota bacterium]
MRAILLSAGLGSRLRPLNDYLPKCLAPVNGRPLMEFWLRALSKAGVGPVLINLHTLSETVLHWVENSEFADNVITVYEDELLGTGGTLLNNRDFPGNEPLMLIHGDNLCIADLEAFMKAHFMRPLGTEITMMTFRTSSPESCGIVELDSSGIVQAFHEKVPDPPGNLANAAVYILEPSVIRFLEGMKTANIDFSTQVLPRFLGRIYSFHNSIYHRDIGSIESLIAAQIEFPLPSVAPIGHDAWKALCNQKKDLSYHTLMTLAEFFNANIIDEKDGYPDFYGLNHFDYKDFVIVHIRSQAIDINAIVQKLKSQLPSDME